MARRPNSLPLVLVAFRRFASCRHSGATGFLLESTIPITACGRTVSIRSARHACFANGDLYFRPLSVFYAIYSGKKITRDKLSACAEAIGYQRGAHREEDSRADRHKPGNDATKDQEGALLPKELPTLSFLSRPFVLRKVSRQNFQCQISKHLSRCSGPAGVRTLLPRPQPPILGLLKDLIRHTIRINFVSVNQPRSSRWLCATCARALTLSN